MSVIHVKFRARRPIEHVKIEFLPADRKRHIAHMWECGVDADRISVIMALDIETVRNINAEYNHRHADLWGGNLS